MKVQHFLNKKSIETPEDITLQLQLFAYLIAKHYGISLTEVYQMSEEIFSQSLVWAMAIEEEEKKAMERSRVSSDSGSSEVISLDYSFLNFEEDF